MNLRLNRALCASTALATGLLIATGALAQSTGSAVVEEVVVTGTSGPRSLDGFQVQVVSKSKTTIDQTFIAKQQPGQTIAETLNVVPGYNFTNNDAYGNSGGNIRLHSFDNARISFQWDGIQLNDSGNYAIFTNQVGDSEIISSAEVAQGSTDVDSPTASAVGGAINYRTKTPDKTMGGHMNLSAGSYAYTRAYGEFDTGEFGPWGTRALITASKTQYNKFKGEGSLDKLQFNGEIYQPLRDNGDFVRVMAHWNQNRNNFYRNPTLAQYQQFGYQFDEDAKCTLPTPVAGTAQNATTQSTIVDFTGSIVNNTTCTNFAGVRINPSNTGNIRGQFKWHFADNVVFTFDPSFQYVLANGGGFTVVSETDNRLRGAAGPTAPGRDLNGDGDTQDSVAMYTPNTTNTHRYGLNTSIIWDMTPNQHFRLAYSLDYAHHRQTGEYTYLQQNGVPLNVFGGKDGYGPSVPTNDGSILRGRDRFSIAELNMFAGEYFGRFLDQEKLEVRLGVRAPYFKRDLNQFCYSQNGSTTVLCTTQPVTTTLPNGNVMFAGNTNQFIKPYTATKKYDKVLPTLGLTYRFTDEHSIYGNYSEGLSVPRTDNLYTITRAADGSLQNPGVQPETTKTFDIGYRYTTPHLLGTLSAYDTKFQNRIASSFDQDLNVFIDRNIGAVDVWGVDASAVWNMADNLNYTGKVSYVHSKVKSDSPLSGGNVLPIAGKEIVETPDWNVFQRVEWQATDLITAGVQMDYVSARWATDVNDQQVKGYTLWDADLRIKLPFWGGDRVYLQANVKNIADVKYFGSISTTNNAITVPGSTGLAPTYALGSPRTFQFTLHADF